jgi:hypothetical protein
MRKRKRGDVVLMNKLNKILREKTPSNEAKKSMIATFKDVSNELSMTESNDLAVKRLLRTRS